MSARASRHAWSFATAFWDAVVVREMEELKATTCPLTRPATTSLIRLAAVRGEEIVGYVFCARYDEAYHVMTLATAPEHRREGIASALLEAVIVRAGEDANYTLEARVSNLGAIALYERYGFRGVGTRPHYYADNGEDALIMWRAVGTPWESA